MNIKHKILLLLLSYIIIGSGCKPRSPNENPDRTKADIVPAVELIDESALKNLIIQRNGKILLLNVWATWCSPCVEEFPDLVKLAGTIDKNECEIVGISVDDIDEINSKVLPFLKKNKVPFKIFIAKIGKQEDFINTLSGKWNGAIPATFIYDSSGRRRSFSIGMKTYEEFKKEIEIIK